MLTKGVKGRLQDIWLPYSHGLILKEIFELMLMHDHDNITKLMIKYPKIPDDMFDLALSYVKDITPIISVDCFSRIIKIVGN